VAGSVCQRTLRLPDQGMTTSVGTCWRPRDGACCECYEPGAGTRPTGPPAADCCRLAYLTVAPLTGAVPVRRPLPWRKTGQGGTGGHRCRRVARARSRVRVDGGCPPWSRPVGARPRCGPADRAAAVGAAPRVQAPGVARSRALAGTTAGPPPGTCTCLSEPSGSPRPAACRNRPLTVSLASQRALDGTAPVQGATVRHTRRLERGTPALGGEAVKGQRRIANASCCYHQDSLPPFA
jgi:hypothetical protein